MAADALFQPFTFKGLKLPNRVVMAPMTRSQSPGGVATEDVAAYYRRRAEGQVGLVISEGTGPARPASLNDPHVPRFHGEAELAAWKTVIDQVHELLASRIPEQQGVSIVHGDYRLDNTVLDDAGTVQAILDWEICTLGDPLADLGLLLVYWAEPDDRDQALLGVAPTALPGFSRRSDLLARYADITGRDVSQIAYYRAFGFWKLGCILQGVHVRYAGGAAAGDRSGVEQFAAHVGRLGERALAEVESL